MSLIWSDPNVLELSFVSISTLPEKLKTASALTTYWRCCPLSCVMWTLIQQLRQTERRTPMTSFITRKKIILWFDKKRARIGDFIHLLELYLYRPQSSKIQRQANQLISTQQIVQWMSSWFVNEYARINASSITYYNCVVIVVCRHVGLTPRHSPQILLASVSFLEKLCQFCLSISISVSRWSLFPWQSDIYYSIKGGVI